MPAGSWLEIWDSLDETVGVQREGRSMNNYMMEIVAKEWLRARLEEQEKDRMVRQARMAAAAEARGAVARPAKRWLVARRRHRAGGNAFFAEELLMAAGEDGRSENPASLREGRA